jgi:hypothetical protein
MLNQFSASIATGVAWAWNLAASNAVPYVAGAGSIVGIGLLFLFMWPHKCEKAFALIWKFCTQLRLFGSFAHKNYMRHDLQGRVNDFISRRANDTPGLSANQVRLEWIDPNTTKESLLDENIVIIRIKRDDNDARSFARAAYLFIATSLLYKAKRYLSPSQASATDLFVSMKLLQEEKPEIVDAFLEEHLHPKADAPESKVNKYFDTFQVIANAGLFFPVYLQELHFVGQKVFGDRKDEKINMEVDALVGHLEKIALRRVGDTSVPLNFLQDYCRFGVMIVGIPDKIERSIDPYVDFIKESIIPSKIETLYLLGSPKNKFRIEEVAKAVEDSFHTLCAHEFKRTIVMGDTKEKRSTYLQVLRSKEAEIFIESQKGL